MQVSGACWTAILPEFLSSVDAGHREGSVVKVLPVHARGPEFGLAEPTGFWVGLQAQPGKAETEGLRVCWLLTPTLSASSAFA